MSSNQRGGIVAKNDNGTLERVDGSSTYIGSATLENGKVITKRFRGGVPDEPKIIQRWEKWQGKKGEEAQEEEEDMAAEINKAKSVCPFNGGECGPRCPVYNPASRACSIMLGGIALYNISANLSKLDPNESLELVAMAVGEIRGGASSKPEPVETPVRTIEDGLDAYFKGRGFLAFVNLHSKTVYAPYKKFCEKEGFPTETESNFTKEVLRRCPELRGEKAHGGKTFVAA